MGSVATHPGRYTSLKVRLALNMISVCRKTGNLYFVSHCLSLSALFIRPTAWFSLFRVLIVRLSPFLVADTHFHDISLCHFCLWHVWSIFLVCTHLSNTKCRLTSRESLRTLRNDDSSNHSSPLSHISIMEQTQGEMERDTVHVVCSSTV